MTSVPTYDESGSPTFELRYADSSRQNKSHYSCSYLTVDN
jgi:hypothetical protein